MMIGPTLIAVLGPPIAVSIVLAITAGVGQTRGVLSPKALKPKWSRLSPKQGIDKFKPKTMAFETLRVILKTALLIGVLWVPIESIVARAPATRGITEWMAFASSAIATVLLWSAALATVIAAIDYAYKRRKLTGETKMTRQEIRDESKDSEGDPMVRQARKERARELSRNRMIADVSTAGRIARQPRSASRSLSNTTKRTAHPRWSPEALASSPSDSANRPTATG